jgi:predicted dehydrogenase
VDVILIGLSRVARKRVLPALATDRRIECIHVASRSASPRDLEAVPKLGRRFGDYETALAASAGALAYVSLPNAHHAHWARRALEFGHHTVIDKPAVLRPSEAEELQLFAIRRDLCLAEATAYVWHPQIERALRIFTEAGSEPRHITAAFSFPPLASNDFRYERVLGGGAVFDLGPYVASCGRIFFGDSATEVVCRVLESATPDGVETAFSVLAIYPRGRALLGHFGFTTEYRNTIALLGPHVFVELDRAFTVPADARAELRVRQKNVGSVEICEPADCFGRFLGDVIGAIEHRTFAAFGQALVDDARAVGAMRTSAELT